MRSAYAKQNRAAILALLQRQGRKTVAAKPAAAKQMYPTVAYNWSGRQNWSRPATPAPATSTAGATPNIQQHLMLQMLGF